MTYPLKLGESRVSLWLQCFGPQYIPVSLGGALEASLLKGGPDCIVGNASILHLHRQRSAARQKLCTNVLSQCGQQPPLKADACSVRCKVTTFGMLDWHVTAKQRS